MAAGDMSLPQRSRNMSTMRVPNQSRTASSLGCLLGILLSLLAGCIPAAPQVVKIGLVAPFVGRYREIGDDVIPAARLAVREWAEQHGSGLVIELVAYDDAGDQQQAVDQALNLVIDPEVEIVVGHWLDETTQAALPMYQDAGLPLITFSESDLVSKAGIYNLWPWLPRDERRSLDLDQMLGADHARNLH